MKHTLLLTIALLLFAIGCGTTRWSDTQRTGTEQLLLSDAMDRAVNRLDFKPLSGKTIFLDPTAVKATVDGPYLASSIRQQLMAQGCIVKDNREDADYVVELRAGAVGTDHREVLFGIPATRVPDGMTMAAPASIPELPLAKKTEQRAVAKIALFAYNRETGRPVWQSGTVPIESKMKDVWVLGAGPFQQGGIVTNLKKGQNKTKTIAPVVMPGDLVEGKGQLAVTDEARFIEPRGEASARKSPPANKNATARLDLSSDTSKKPQPLPGLLPLKDGPPKLEPPGPLDGVVPATHIEPIGASFSAQPNSGMDSFWPLATPAQPAAAPGAPAAAPNGINTTPSGVTIPPLSGWSHGGFLKGKG